MTSECVSEVRICSFFLCAISEAFACCFVIQYFMFKTTLIHKVKSRESLEFETSSESHGQHGEIGVNSSESLRTTFEIRISL